MTHRFLCRSNGFVKPTTRSSLSTDVSLDIKKGEFMTFLGPSGSGKSTTLYIVAGFQSPTEGRVLLDGKSLLSVAPNKRNIGMVFQRYTLFPHLTVGENVAFPLQCAASARCRGEAKVEQMLKLVRPRRLPRPHARGHCRAGSSSASRLPARSPTIRRSS